MPGWLTRSPADVPADDDWLSAAERRVLAGLRVERRRADWRLGRFTAKAAVASWLAIPAARVEILAAADGAPEAFVDAGPAGVSVSLSHRAGLALAAVADAPRVVGCDLELVEPRSGAFVREWLAPAEQALVAAAGDAFAGHAVRANLVWTAKEAAAKVRREGLRLDVRHAVAVPADGLPEPDGAWRALRVEWSSDAGATPAWWRLEPRWAMTVAAEPAAGPPRRLGAPGATSFSRAGARHARA